MNISLSDEELQFRADVRGFLAEQFPEDIHQLQVRGIPLGKEEQVRWQKILHRRGWAAVNWPVEYGGTGWSAVQKYVFANELALANAPDMIPFGVKMVGPVIYTYGSEEQKRRFLPDILDSQPVPPKLKDRLEHPPAQNQCKGVAIQQCPSNL